jgi:signal transduction histidine kinase/CheY-like chemotaxis protein
LQENLLSTHDGEQPLRKLFELSRKLVTSLNLNNTLQATVDGVSILTGLDSAAVYLLEGNMLRLGATTPPLPSDFPDELRYSSLKDFPHIGRSIDSATPVYIQDVANETLSQEEESVSKLRDIRTLLFLPLIAETEVLGALSVGSIGSPKPISNSAMDLSHTLANFAALAVKNARLYQAGQKHTAELEQTINECKLVETEREKLQEQLIQSQKMDAIGQLAGGIAHDFNNMLCGIIGHAELLYLSTSLEESHQLIKEIITISQRSADLISQLLAFSRKGQIQRIPVNLHKIVEEVVSILRHTISRNIEIKLDMQAAAFFTEGDPAQIQSTLLNLAVNARDAMPDGGILSLVTRNINLLESNCHQLSCQPTPGEYIELTVTDTGTGMDTATLERIYEPFFTTKKHGEGTGMGLSAVYGTMKSLGGAISVSSKTGQGTTFTLYFPFKNQTVKTAHDSEIVHPGNCNISMDMKKILVIDDEETVASATARHLISAGYKVDFFTDSIAALSFFKDNHPAINLVILDMIMPKMDGPAIFNSLREIKPDVRFILSSGFSVNGAIQQLLNDGAQLFLPKPFRQDELIDAVCKALEA